jgi:hypothetical protein
MGGKRTLAAASLSPSSEQTDAPADNYLVHLEARGGSETAAGACLTLVSGKFVNQLAVILVHAVLTLRR